MNQGGLNNIFVVAAIVGDKSHISIFTYNPPSPWEKLPRVAQTHKFRPSSAGLPKGVTRRGVWSNVDRISGLPLVESWMRQGRLSGEGIPNYFSFPQTLSNIPPFLILSSSILLVKSGK